ncbi:MAG TPA: hypothetical protein VKF32_10320 [Thermoanaerobaculia bacterium]|nr:hypothetical protein [Thermoanaerobaculia bacterium]
MSANPKLTIVLTTINVPTLLAGYADNFDRHGHLGKVDVIVVGDRKTPHPANRDLAAKLTARGLPTEYMDVETQDAYMKRFPEMDGLIPYDSDQRRNIGYLKAAEQGAEIVGLLDDDNFVTDDDWYGEMSIVGRRVSLPTVESSNQWFNPCAMLETDPPGRILFPRGHPYSRRHRSQAKETRTVTEGRVAINAGLWLREADVDSLTRLTEPVQTTALKDEQVMCAPGTWANINTQNTSFHRDVLPAYYFVPLTARIGGHIIERYGDIWAGHFVRKAIDVMDDRVAYGRPLADQVRNVHDLLHDLQLEYWGVLLNEQLWEQLYEWKVDGGSYANAYLSIADHLDASTWKGVPLVDEVRAHWRRMARAMRAWVAATRRLGY